MAVAGLRCGAFAREYVVCYRHAGQKQENKSQQDREQKANVPEPNRVCDSADEEKCDQRAQETYRIQFVFDLYVTTSLAAHDASDCSSRSTASANQGKAYSLCISRARARRTNSVVRNDPEKKATTDATLIMTRRTLPVAVLSAIEATTPDMCEVLWCTARIRRRWRHLQ